MIYEILFVLFALGAFGFHIFSLLDARKNLWAARYAKHYAPHLYRPEQEAVAQNSLRNEGYRLGVQALIVVISFIMVSTAIPRSPELIALITILATVVAGVIFISAIHEWIRRRDLLRLFTTEQERQFHERE